MPLCVVTLNKITVNNSDCKFNILVGFLLFLYFFYLTNNLPFCDLVVADTWQTKFAPVPSTIWHCSSCQLLCFFSKSTGGRAIAWDTIQWQERTRGDIQFEFSRSVHPQLLYIFKFTDRATDFYLTAGNNCRQCNNFRCPLFVPKTNPWPAVGIQRMQFKLVIPISVVWPRSRTCSRIRCRSSFFSDERTWLDPFLRYWNALEGIL